jgi:CBS domain containing-hemolysin-like protein
MLLLIFALFVLAFLLFGVVLLKVYQEVPLKELKRRVRKGDEIAKLLHGPVAYGKSLDLLLWIDIALSGSLLTHILSRLLPLWLSVFIVAGLIWVVFAWLPNTRITSYAVKLATFVSPALKWLLERLHPLLLRASKFVERHQSVTVHTGLYTKEDIVELIDQQKIQTDNDIDTESLQIVKHALQFGDKKVADVMTPRRMMKTVADVDVLGPVLMGELHDSGHSRFPVYENDEENFVGTLYLRDAIGAKAGGFVKGIMRKETFFVNDQQSIARVLDAFIKTKHHMFLAVNNFEEVVGIITIEDVVEQVIGKQIIDEFDQYEDLRAVAQMEAEKERDEREVVVEANAKEPEDDK